jgi:3-oxoacyl-[acyl-carrier protein] reductase
MKKTIVVTGGSRGIGLAIAKTLVAAGYQVVVIARNDPGAIVSDQHGTCGFLKWDLSDIDSYSDLAHTLRDKFEPVYGLINNAGTSLSGILSNTSSTLIEQTIRLNVVAPITLTKFLVRPMLNARAGRIVNISSIVASTGYAGLSVYSATKAALVGFTHSLAREVGPLGITVNAVAPGFIDTDMTESLDAKQREQIKRRSALQRMATADDVAAAVGFLMSDAAKNITGTVMTVDAGNTA